MPRTLDPAAHAVRRDSFVEAAQAIIATRGYEAMSIQDVLDELGASKGAFYHYFDSKEALLDAVVERTIDTGLAAAAPVVSEPGLTGPEKFQRLFSGLSHWKGERPDLMVALLEVWLSDGNGVVREHYRRGVEARLLPLIQVIVRQGVAEGTFSATCPDETAGVLVTLVLGANETATRLFLARRAGTISFEEVQRTLLAYQEALERVLGVPRHALEFFDEELVRYWFG